MLSWLRRFPNDVMHRNKSTAGSGRRTSSSTSWRNKSNSFTARIIRCASSVAAAGRRHSGGDEDEDCGGLPSSPPPPPPPPPPSLAAAAASSSSSSSDYNNSSSSNTVTVSARAFSFRELADAAGNFRQDNLIGEGGFGRVYKARLPRGTGDDDDLALAAVKQLDRNGAQGNSEFVVEVLMLSMLHHPNLVNLLGYCADGDQRLLVYEYMPLGSLEDHLLLPSAAASSSPPITSSSTGIPWRTRMKIAHGAARGLEYLHDRAVIYRDLKSSNILLDHDYSPRLSDFGLAKLLPVPRAAADDDSSSSSASSSGGSKVMGTYGYCAPEYLRTGKLSLKSDVYSFGVLLLELVTGRRAIDVSRPDGEQSLVGWAAPLFAHPSRLHELVDPRLVMAMQPPPPAELKQAVGVASMCLQEHHAVRPVMTDVVMALSAISDS
ncbi:hypothetical protein U9M48_005706 [Paspalum notatum var. saurae]|uniref:non-specific serine/threonine protein kinase n=1 Tax=Paspalum notatum var. saurae TaxID=547442 RepID=A0AAQ3PST2_PASNO